jgi:hypothetical protein
MGRTGKGVAVDCRRVDAGSESWEELRSNADSAFVSRRQHTNPLSHHLHVLVNGTI